MKCLVFKHIIVQIVLTLGLFGTTNGKAVNQSPSYLEQSSLIELEKELIDIDSELSGLARYSLRGGLGTIGYRSNGYKSPNHLEWIEIDLRETILIDRVILVPTILRDPDLGFAAEAFPKSFKVSVGTTENPNGKVVANYTAKDPILPRIAPLTIEFPPTTASWIRIEATELTQRGFDGTYFLQLAEIFVFSQYQNVALKKEVTISSSGKDNAYFFESRVWNKTNMVDGFVPYLMDTTKGQRSQAFLSEHNDHSQPFVIIDLEEGHLIEQVNIHTVDQSSTVPLSLAGDFGIPRYLRIEGSMHADFSDSILLYYYVHRSVNDAGPIIMLPFSKAECRYIRMVAEHNIEEDYQPHDLGFAEIEILSNGHNVAMGKPVLTNLLPERAERNATAITDGNNFYGQILPTRDWLWQLSRRHDLERIRPRVVEEINKRFDSQQNLLKWMSWLVITLVFASMMIFLVVRIVQLRYVAQIKERFAADLHDEIGANVHTIGLLSDAATLAHQSPDKWQQLHQQIREITVRSGNAIRHCTNLLESKGLYIGLIEDIKREAKRNMAQLEHDFTVEGEEYIETLKPRTRVDLFLFYKECLVNVCRHSGATKFSTKIVGANKSISLTIADNGKGLSDLSDKKMPKSLSRRAHLLKGKLEVETIPTGGTKIVLMLKRHKWT